MMMWSRRTIARGVAAYLVTIAFACIPVDGAVRLLSRGFPPDPLIVARATLAIALALGVVWFALKVAGFSRTRIASAIAVAMCWISIYPAARDSVANIANGSLVKPVGLVYLGMALIIMIAFLRLRGAIIDVTYQGAAIMAVVIVAGFSWNIWSTYRQQFTGVIAETRSFDSVPLTTAHTQAPDVYDIVLDGFGRPDVLKAMYGLDLSHTIERLKHDGFTIDSTIGTANYTQTYLSLASLLNAKYLDWAAKQIPDSQSRMPMRLMIENSSVVHAFRRVGYRIHVIGSTYSALEALPQADVCDCDFPLIGEFEGEILRQTPLAEIGLNGIDYWPHRNKIRRSLHAIDSLTPTARPRFLLAHIMAPHPPFVFDERGSALNPQRLFSLFDASMFRGTREEYTRGYRRQATYIASLLPTMAERFVALSASRHREAVIIIHGDHGPRFLFDALDAARTNPSECLPIFLAIRWPRTATAPSPDVKSLVNVYRALFQAYFGANIQNLPDRAFVSSFRRPYRFLEVDPATLAGPAIEHLIGYALENERQER